MEVRDRDSRLHITLMVIKANSLNNKISGTLPDIKIIKIIRNLCKRPILQMFIFTFLIGICKLKPVDLFTNSMKKCMDIENVGSVYMVDAFFTRKMSVNQMNIRGVCRCHAMLQ